jgi:AcrR family transcriptional regulator
MGRPPLKKRDIERAALELFAEHGIDGTSIRMIADRAGVTEGALYRHHPGKEHLVRALFQEYFERFAQLLTQARDSADPLDRRIRAMVDGFFAAYDEDPRGFQFVLLVQHAQLESVRKDSGNPVEVIMGVLREAIRRGEIPRQDVALSAQLLMGLVMQTAVGHRYRRVQGPLTKHAGTVAAACLRVLRFQPQD